MKIYKYVVTPPNNQSRSYVTMPSSAVPISVGIQEGRMVVWAQIPSDWNVLVHDKRFIVVNTGVDFEGWDGLGEPEFLGTVTSDGIVWHVFYEWYFNIQ